MRGDGARPAATVAKGWRGPLPAVAQPRRPWRDGVAAPAGGGGRGGPEGRRRRTDGLGSRGSTLRGRRRRWTPAPPREAAPAMAARAVLDEFTAPAEKAVLLERSRGRIEGLFGVSLAVLGALGAEEPLPARIWLQLRGAQEAVHSAKVSPAAAPALPLPCSPRPSPALAASVRSGSLGAPTPALPAFRAGTHRSAVSGARGPAFSALGPCDLGLAS